MPEPTVPDPTTEPKPSNFSLAHIFWGAGGILATLLATMIFNHSQVAAPAPKPAAAPAPATPRTVQVVTLFDCQYLSFTEPFFILHLPQCTNCAARKK